MTWYRTKGDTQLNTETWYHIAVTYNGSDIVVYVNGTDDGSSSAAITLDMSDNAEVLTIGKTAWSVNNYNFNGTIDELRIWNRSLSANEIALLYNNRTNTTHNNATTAPQNWTAKVTPIDDQGLNGTEAWSNSINITEMAYSLLNQSPSVLPESVVNVSEPVNIDQNLTIRINATNLGGTISTVWIIIWETAKSAGDIMWQGVMNLIGGVWTIEIPVNESYPNVTNYTVYINDSYNITYEIDGNFSTNSPPVLTSVEANTTSAINASWSNITAKVTGVSDPEGNSVYLNYDWLLNGISDTTLNLPMTAPNRDNKTTDMSTNARHGSIVNAEWNATGGFNGFGAYEFDALGEYINTSTAFGGTDFTYGAWVRFDEYGGCLNQGSGAVCLVLTQANAGGVGHLMLINSSGGLWCYDGSNVAGSNTLDIGSWYHAMCVHNSTDFALFINGELNSSWVSSSKCC